jgi:signal-transduction protein with cAMP-binding, CBS, and nucleotidyltransferase domain
MTTAIQAMLPLEKMKRVGPGTELWAAVEEMDRDRVNQLPIMTDGQIQGMLTREGVISYLHNLQEFSRLRFTRRNTRASSHLED